jgi:rhodanese-related sulfurtransferase
MTFSSRTQNPDFEGVYDISPEELARCSANEVAMIDVREPAEYVGELGHIAEAKLIPLATIPEQVTGLSKESTVVFVCRSGGRSARAAAFAQSLGFQNAYNMKGGMILWNALGLPVVKA